MASAPPIPIVVGVGDIVNRSLTIEDAIEPLELMLQTILKAINDTDAPSIPKLQSSIDSIDVVRTWTWPYSNLPRLLSQRLGIAPSHQSYSPHGGNQPAKLLDETAQRIARRDSSIAVVVGGEALASLNACASAGCLPPTGWTEVDQRVDAVFSPTTSDLGSGLGALHSIGHPIQVYPLYENALRARRGQSIAENSRESANIYTEFSKVATEHRYSWSYGKAPVSQETIGTVTKKNRMICFPYPLLMNAFNMVNLAAACLLTSTAKAKELGIPESKWIYPLAGAGTQDNDEFWQRPNYHSSPAISKSISACLRSSGLTKDDIDLCDIYSCFPIVPKLAGADLGLSIVKKASKHTLLGGLTSFGGAGNNYSMHVGKAAGARVHDMDTGSVGQTDIQKALTELTRQLRQKKGTNGLVLANGGILTYQHAVVLSSRPRTDGSTYPIAPLLPKIVTDVPIPAIAEQAQGESVIETYTVDFDRNGSPLRGHIVGRLTASDQRFIANHADDETLKQLSSWEREPIGRMGWVSTDEESGRNLFSFDKKEKL